jgi:hypothetical protein
VASVQEPDALEDFYDTSGCRDLLFHAKENRFTLRQIKEILAELELDFLKFNVDPVVQQRYALQYPGELARADLNCWTQFEVENPGTFLGMYNFYAQGRALARRIHRRKLPWPSGANRNPGGAILNGPLSVQRISVAKAEGATWPILPVRFAVRELDAKDGLQAWQISAIARVPPKSGANSGILNLARFSDRNSHREICRPRADH